MTRPTRYPPHFRAEAVALVTRIRPSHPSEWAAIQSVASTLAISAETLRTWVRNAEAPHDAHRVRARRQQAEIRRLVRENAELRRALRLLDVIDLPEPPLPLTFPRRKRTSTQPSTPHPRPDDTFQ